jgi:hypothetical protein
VSWKHFDRTIPKSGTQNCEIPGVLFSKKFCKEHLEVSDKISGETLNTENLNNLKAITTIKNDLLKSKYSELYV